MDTLDTARSYLKSGLCVLPAIGPEKRPAVRTWKPYQHRPPTDAELQAWFGPHTALCVVTGSVSGNAHVIDFDHRAELYPAWHDLVESEAPGLADRVVRERSQSGGIHGIYRCEEPVPAGAKLAQRTITTPDDRPVVIDGKTYRPRWAGDRWEVIITLIETRGEGNLVLCAPSPGYTLEHGRLEDLPILTGAEHRILMGAARSLDELPQRAEPEHRPASEAVGRPGDEFNERGDVRSVLVRHGWTLARPGENEYWRRPGKDRGWSATLKDRVFYSFTPNAPPFDQDKAYSPFSVYALLEHNGDFGAAASALRAEGYGHELSDNADVDISALMPGQATDENAGDDTPDDPGPIPESLLHVPGFIDEVMDYTLEISPYPSVPLAFCGALSLQSFLAGRKVRDPSDVRTNLYLLALAHSSVGKDHPRKVNAQVLLELGLIDCLGDKFASGEGLQDALFINPSMPFQNDEIDGILRSINKSRDARHEAVMGSLLTMYTSSASVYPMRRKAGKESPGVIDQPHLTLFGTAVPSNYYEALSEQMLTNGLFARMIIVDVGKRAKGQEAGRVDQIPQRVLDTGLWWNQFTPGETRGNLQQCHPVPVVVEYTDEAAQMMIIDWRRHTEVEYGLAEDRNDEVGMTVWGRVAEQTRKLALLYAVSENHQTPRIGTDAVEWAKRFVDHQTRRMLFMVADNVTANEFHAQCLKVIKKLRKEPGNTIAHSVLLKRMKLKTKDFKELIDTLVEQRAIRVVNEITPGRIGTSYKLIEGVKEGEKEG